jgi:predicted DNA-binding transcriptional regulator AlpA
MATLPNTQAHLLNEYQVAAILGVSVATVRRWRLLRQGPKYLKIGAAVRYKHQDLDSWLASRPTGGADICVDASANAGSVPVATEVPSRKGGRRNA